MSNTSIFTIAAAALLSTSVLPAQAPASTAPGTPAPGAATTSGTAATGAPATPKPISSSDAKAMTDLFDAMHFHLHIANHARHKDKDDKEMVSYAVKNHKEMTDLFTPLMTAAQARQMKNIPAEPSKADKEAVSKVGKEKGDKWKAEYYELLAKQGKRNTRTAENAAKNLSDAELKATATKVAAAIAAQTTEAENKLKELKAAKK